MVVAWSTRYMRGFSFRIAVTSSGGILYPATRRSRSPSQRNSEPNFASQTWTALASIAWKTGSSSVGELLMTCSTSDVARCCSRASVSSRVRASSCFFNSISELGPLLTRALAFVPVERSLRPRVGLFAPLRDKVTSSTRLVDLCWLLQTSFNHLVGVAEQWQRNRQPKYPGGLEVDDQLGNRGLLDGQLCRFGALENAAGIGAQQPILLRNSAPVAHQSAGRDKGAILIDGRQCIAKRQSRKPL